MQNLRSIYGRLELFEESPDATEGHAAIAKAVVQPTDRRSRDVFIVHGRNEATKQTVARFLEKLRVTPIILHEHADKGRTIIQKFEDHSSVGFAVVLLTPDDEGRLQGDTEFKLRSRQNVVLELGYFIGKLGRARVCALKMDDVEEPSDLHGVLYIPFDAKGAWKLLLARELKAAEIDVDLNLAL